MNKEKYIIQCFVCATAKDLTIVPHKNDRKHIVGTIYVCTKCLPEVLDKQLKFKIEG